MALTITRVWTEPNYIAYLVTTSGSPLGGEGTIPAAGGVTPDLVTDGAINTDGGANSSALRRVVRAGLDGIGTVAAGALTQADARNLLLGDGSTSIGNGKTTPRALVTVVPRTGTVADWKVDADVDGSGRPEINIDAAAVAATAYLYVKLDHTLAK